MARLASLTSPLTGARASNVNYLGAARCRRKFELFYPDGFADETYQVAERSFKERAHLEWQAELGPVEFRKLLAHQPRTAPAAVKAGFDLQVSGHTHGGQFWPWVHFVRFQQPYTAGLHRMDGLWVYVSRGTGYWGPPKRFGAPSEITKILLRKGSG